MAKRDKSTPADFAQKIRVDIRARTDDTGGRKTVVSRKLRTVLDEAGGWKKKGSCNVGLIEDALSAAGVHTDCVLGEADIDTYVWFADHPIRRRQAVPLFDSERALVSFIESNYRLLFNGVPELAAVELVAAEVEYQRTPTAERPDLVFLDPERRLIVAEVEVGDPQGNSAFQVLQYMNVADARLGVLITACPSSAALEENVKEALELMGPEKPTIWLKYDVALSRLD